MNDLLVVVGILVVVIGLLVGTVYLGGQQKLKCIETVKHLPAADIAVVCRR